MAGKLCREKPASLGHKMSKGRTIQNSGSLPGGAFPRGASIISRRYTRSALKIHFKMFTSRFS